MIKFSKEKVLLLHKMIAQETGGSIGVRDEGLLESALQVAFPATAVRNSTLPKKKRVQGSDSISYPITLLWTATSASVCMSC